MGMLTDSAILKVCENVRDEKSAKKAANLILLSEARVSAGETVVSLDSLPTYPLDGVKLKVKSVNEESGYAMCVAPDGKEYEVMTSMLAAV